MRTCLICDDHGLIREAIAATIRRRWPTVEVLQAADFPTAWAMAARGPDLCLVDLDMPGADSRAGVAGILSAAPETRLLVVTGLDDDQLMLDLLDNGVAGFAPKSLDTEVLAAAIELVMAGGRYLPARLADLATGGARSRSAAPATGRESPGRGRLTPRQREVLRMMAEGLSNKEIARNLSLSPATVKTHVAQIIAAVDAANRTEASVKGRALGLI